MQEHIIIAKPAAAAVFASARQRAIVQTLMGSELALSELARATETPLNLLHYHVSKCVALGLIEVVREKGRAGRSVKYYRATARVFFVPAELIVETPGTAFTYKLRELLDQNLAKSLQGISFSHDGHRPRADLIKDQNAQSGAVELWLDVGLSSADAAELAEELQSVIDRFRVRGNDGAPRYLVHLAAVKV